MKRHPSATRLSREAERLLAALQRTGACAVSDPIEPEAVIVRAERKGVSLGTGAFKSAAAEELVKHDLASMGRGGRQKLMFRITEPGRAYLHRRSSDDEIAFQVQHQDRLEEHMDVEGARVKVTIDTTENPLDWLRRRKDRNGQPLVDEACYQAGERLRRDLTVATMLPSVTSRWDGLRSLTRGGANFDPAGASDAAIAARQRVTAALRAVGADLADLLLDVCGFLKGLEQIERERGWPPRSGKIIVNLALARLADHYGLQRSARGPAESRGIRAWHAVVLDGTGD
jgi:hypothetical protein